MHSGNFKKLGILFLIFILVLSSCHTKKHSASPSFVILAINDVYRIEGLDQGNVGGLARVRALRNQLESEGKKFCYCTPEISFIHLFQAELIMENQ